MIGAGEGNRTLVSSLGSSAKALAFQANVRQCCERSTWAHRSCFRSLDRGGCVYTHALLPGWEYARREVVAEMIPDLDALAERGVRPTEAMR